MSPIRRAPGSAPFTVELDGTRNYVFELGFSLDVLFGTDPDVTYDFTGGGFEVSAVSTVPEWADVAPWTGMALAGWAFWRPRRG